MKVYDLVGNVMMEGSTLYFKPLDAMVQVAKIEEPGKIDGNNAPGVLTLTLKVPFRPDKGNTDVRFADMLVIPNPAEAARVEHQIAEILKGKPKHTLKLAKEA